VFLLQACSLGATLQVRGGLRMTHQRHARLGFDGCVELLQKSHFASLKKSNGNTIAEQHAIAGDRRKLGTRHQDASEVQRVSA